MPKNCVCEGWCDPEKYPILIKNNCIRCGQLLEVQCQTGYGTMCNSCKVVMTNNSINNLNLNN